MVNAVLKTVATPVRRLLHAAGLDIIRWPPQRPYPPDFDCDEIAAIEAARPYTLTCPERIVALRRAVHYLAANAIPGALVECGVWKGGSMMTVACTLETLGVRDRDLYLFDTFRGFYTYKGIPRPTEVDVSYAGERALDTWARDQGPDGPVETGCKEVVRGVLASSGYPMERVHFVEGNVVDTIPASAPDQIALLRLDTDWYESTLHEMEHLFPRLARGGVLIIDDYGYWLGSQKATQEYLARSKTPLFLHRIDFSSRIAVKL